MSAKPMLKRIHAISLPRRSARGFSLVELMVAMTLGVLLTWAAATVYLSSKSSFRRQEQLSVLQQNARMAFEHLSVDTRAAGHMGCYTGQGDNPQSDFATGSAADKFKTNYTVGVEGYEYQNATAGAFTLASRTPTDSSSPSDWKTNADANGTTTIPLSTIAGAGKGLTPGSDVLVIRTIAGNAIRLTAASTAAKALAINGTAGGTCSDGATQKISGLCSGNHVLVANCTKARMFPVGSITTSALTTAGADFVAGEYQPANTEVLPLQTVVYYVKSAAGGEGTSLYRRVFDGAAADGVEDELIQGVENLQVRYGRDTSSDADGTVDDYVTAEAVIDWSRVLTVRMSLLMRSSSRLPDGAEAAGSGVLNGVTVTYPDSIYDRRVFTSTIAVRNKTASF